MRVKSFLGDARGNVAVVFAFSAVPLMGFTGFALDYARASKDRTALQAAVDTAALAALSVQGATDATRIATATRAFNANKPMALTTTPQVTISGKQATVTASAEVPTTLMQVLHIASIPISARAVAVQANNGLQPCVFALSKTGTGVDCSGNASFTGKNCSIHSNSSTTGAVSVSGNASVKAGGYCAVGTVSTTKILTPTPQNNCEALPDPYASLQGPASLACTYNDVSVKPNATQTLSPGVYCGGLSIKGDATLNPGLYVIRDGALTINAQSNVTGDGVTFYLTGAGAGFDINGGSTLNLAAMRSGAYAGLLVVQDRNSNVGATNRLNGNASSTLVGGFYTPTQDLILTGNGSFGQASPYMPLIANTVTFGGNNTTTISVDSTDVPVIAPLPRETSGVRLAG